MNNTVPEAAAPSFTIPDVAFALFRHRLKIILFSILGIAAAAAYYFLTPRYYQSETKLLVKYVLDRSAVDTVESQTQTVGNNGDTLIGTEVTILSSWDLAVAVAEAVGVDRIIEGKTSEATIPNAATAILSGLEVRATRGSNVIGVTFQHPNPATPRPILDELVKRYFDKHLEVHRSTQAFDFVSQQKDLVRSRLNEIDTKLKTLKEQAGTGITSLAESIATVRAEVTRTRQELMAAEANEAEQSARLGYLSKSAPDVPAKNTPGKDPSTPHLTPPAPPVAVMQYQALLGQLAQARNIELELSAKFTDGTTEMKTHQTKLKQLEARRAALEAEYPQLTAEAVKATGNPGAPDPANDPARLAATQAKVAFLKSQLADLEANAARIGAVAPQIEDYEAQRAIEQKNLTELQLKLKKTEIDEALDPSKIPNISVLQKPTPAVRVAGKTLKIVAGLAGGGVGMGLLTALVLGLIFDRSLKRPKELESRLHIPMFLSIPRMPAPGRARRNGARSGSRELAPKTSSLAIVAPWDPAHFVRPFAEAIRNRLILGFELRKINHKPKLIGVTGLSGGEGTSTMAGGLAASLSETGDGNVLLVDMNADNPEMLPFFEGNASMSLLDALQAESNVPSAGEHLFLATGKASASGTLSIAPKKFYDLLPALRSSAFDYIIFDLPPLDQSGSTLAVSGSMDKILFLVEAEKNERDAIRRAYDELTAAKAEVAVVVNKTPTNVPKWARG